MIPPEKFLFVNSLGSHPPPRAQQLQASQIKSHAASVAHERLKDKSRKRRQEQPPPSKAGPVVSPRKSRLPTPPLSAEEEEEKAPPERTASITFPADPYTWSISPPESPESYVDSPEPGYADGTPEDDWEGENDDNPDDEYEEVKEAYAVATTTQSRPIRIAFANDPNTRFLSDFSLNLEAFRGLRTDPFFCIPSTSDTRVASTLDFYCQDLTPRYDLVCDVFDVTNIYAFFLDAVRDEYFYHAGMAALQMVAEQQRAPGSKPSVHVFNHRGRAIGRLRKKLTTPGAAADDITVFAMTFLATLEAGLGNFAAFNLHKTNIGVLVKKRGGLKGLQDGSVVKGTLMQYDTFWALLTGATIFPGERRPYAPIYPSHPLPTMLLRSISELPSGLEILALNGHLSFDILDALVRASERTRTNIHVLRREQAYRRRVRRRYNDFWEACPCFGVLNDQGCNLLEKLLSLALVVFCCLAFDEIRSVNNVLRGSRAELSKKIALFSPSKPPQVLEEVARAQEDCHIWMWTIAVDSWRVGQSFASRNGPPLTPEGTALFCALANKYPRAKNLTTLKQTTRGFLWTKELDKSVASFWQRLARHYDGLAPPTRG